MSRSTVSYALSGRGNLSAATRARVLAEAERLGYRPDPALAAAARSRFKESPRAYSIAYFSNLPSPAAAYSDEGARAWSVLGQEAAAAGYDVFRLPIGETCTPDKIATKFQTCSCRAVLLDAYASDHARALAYDCGVPTVALACASLPGFSRRVAPNWALGKREAVAELRARGARRIGVVQNASMAGICPSPIDLLVPPFDPEPFASGSNEPLADCFASWVAANGVDAVLLMPMVGVERFLRLAEAKQVPRVAGCFLAEREVRALGGVERLMQRHPGLLCLVQDDFSNQVRLALGRVDLVLRGQLPVGDSEVTWLVPPVKHVRGTHLKSEP